MKTWKLAPLMLLVACASNRPVTVATGDPAKTQPPKVVEAPKPMDITGSYEYTTDVNGQAVSGQIIIGGVPGAYNGKITSNAFPEFPIAKASVDGNVITIKGTTDDGDLDLVITMTGETFKGKWVLGSNGGDITGKKLTKT
jgi:hypothetical protein